MAPKAPPSVPSCLGSSAGDKEGRASFAAREENAKRARKEGRPRWARLQPWRGRAGRGPGRPLGCGKSAHHCPTLMLLLKGHAFFWVEEMGQVKVKLNPKLAIGPSSNFEAKTSCFYSRYHQSDADYPPPDQTGLRISFRVGIR